jgi:hypothetical protein
MKKFAKAGKFYPVAREKLASDVESHGFPDWAVEIRIEAQEWWGEFGDDL